MAHSLLLTCACLGSKIRVATPQGYGPIRRSSPMRAKIAKQTGAAIELLTDPHAAVAGVDAVYTDAWASMGQEHEAEKRTQDFSALSGESTNSWREQRRTPCSCIACRRIADEEITDAVMDSEQSVVFDQAESRLHVQKAILYLLLGGGGSPASEERSCLRKLCLRIPEVWIPPSSFRG